MTVWNIPLRFEDNIQQKQITLTINNESFVLLFQLNPIDTNLYLTCYSKNQDIIYFASYRCVFGNYINKLDAGLNYMFFFIDNSGNNYEQIDFIALNNGVNMYAKSR